MSTDSAGPGPLPFRTRAQVRQQIITVLTQLGAGSPPPGGRIDLGDKPWTTAELVEAITFVISLFVSYAETAANMAAAGNPPPDAAAFLQREALDLAANPPLGPFQATVVDDSAWGAPWESTP